jgi:hypothetical protein
MGYWCTQYSTRRLRLHDGYLVAFDSIPKKFALDTVKKWGDLWRFKPINGGGNYSNC